MLVQTSRLQGKLPSAVLWEFSYRVSCQLVKSSIVSALCNETLARPTPQLSALLPFLLLLSCSGSLFVFPTLIPPLLSPFASCSSASLRGTLRLGSVFLPPLVVLRCGLATSFRVMPVTLSSDLLYSFRQHRGSVDAAFVISANRDHLIK